MSGVVKESLSLKPRKAGGTSFSQSPLPPGDRDASRQERVDISRRALRVVVGGESRDDERGAYAPSAYLCADTLCLTLPDTTIKRPEFSLGLSEFGARARPPGDPSPPPQSHLRLCERESPYLRRALPSRDRVSESTSDRSLSAATAREISLLYGEGGPATRRRCLLLAAAHSRSSLTREHRSRRVLWLVRRDGERRTREEEKRPA